MSRVQLRKVGVMGQGKMVQGVVWHPRGQGSGGSRVGGKSGSWRQGGSKWCTPLVLSPLLQKLGSTGSSPHLRGILWPGVRSGRPSGAPTSAGVTMTPQGSADAFGGLNCPTPGPWPASSHQASGPHHLCPSPGVHWGPSWPAESTPSHVHLRSLCFIWFTAR